MINQSHIQRKYNIDENFFDLIDSEERAYFLGLLFADGCNFTKKNTVSIGLQERDKDVLVLLRDAIKTNKPLYFVNRNKSHPTWQNQYKLVIHNKKISATLDSLGCHNKKSLILRFPRKGIIPTNLISVFIRGYFDGDGCIYIDKNNKKDYWAANCSITSTQNFCDNIKKILLDVLGICSFFEKPRKYHNKNTRVLRIGGNQQVLKFLNWIYKDSKICIARKRDKLFELQERMKGKGLLHE
jgi:intein/homing endonuclease